MGRNACANLLAQKMNSLLDPKSADLETEPSGQRMEEHIILEDQIEVDEMSAMSEDLWEDIAHDAGPTAGGAAGPAAGPAAWLGVGAGMPPFIPEILARPHALQRKPRAMQASSVWINLIPDLAISLLAFRKSSFACPPASLAETIHQNCENPACTPTKIRVLCLHISFNTLEIYQALFQRSCIAIQAFTNALTTLYNTRGFELMSKTFDGEHAADPLRQALSQAVHVYSSIQQHIRKMVNDALAKEYCRSSTGSSPRDSIASTCEISPAHAEPHPSVSITGPCEVSMLGAPPAAPPVAPPAGSPPAPPTASPATPPASFTPANHTIKSDDQLLLVPGSANRVLQSRGGDVQFGADGCFNYRHLRAAGNGPSLFSQEYFLTPEEVYKVKETVLLARKSPKPLKESLISADIVDACGESWTAANEHKQKGDPKCYDSTGIFALTCHHSQVLFMCDIDTPGEQQHYIIALLEKVASLLPSNATITQCYDIGCVLDRSNNLFPILSAHLRSRVSFSLNAMHAFGHQWACQLVYNSRMKLGPPVRVQCELSKIVSLQNQIEDIDDTLEQLQKTVEDRQSSESAHIAIQDLQSTHVKLSQQAEHLFTSLNLETHYPELAGLPFEFVQILLLMRDLKIQIRKQAIGTFLEWENLDRAVQGQWEPLDHILQHELEQEINFLQRVASRWRRQLQIPQPRLLAMDPTLSVSSHNFTPAAAPAAAPAATPAAPLNPEPTIEEHTNQVEADPLEDDMNQSLWVDSEDISIDEVAACPSDSEEALAVSDMMETDDDKDTATLEHDNCHVRISWASFTKSRSTCDNNLLRDLTAHVAKFSVIRDLQTRVVVLPGNLPAVAVYQSDLALLTGSTARLNGHILNSVSAAILSWCMQPFSLHALSAQRCALLSTYDLHRVRFNAPDKVIWKNLAPTEYWNKSIWIIPVHRQAQEHWALVIVLVHEQKLLLFDSLA
ncbi:unnamed protein product [Mycena citricolor]|uniref:Ubiquitin-like protease family profile domain-containing protein n=1 Tax=Mycena citricolor TaxID=2018698 RepID=A0AAD2HY11_9AGAR|nr:unnamed protein product [Mycena citricolor]